MLVDFRFGEFPGFDGLIEHLRECLDFCIQVGRQSVEDIIASCLAPVCAASGETTSALQMSTSTRRLIQREDVIGSLLAICSYSLSGDSCSLNTKSMFMCMNTKKPT